MTINAYFTPESLPEALKLKARHGYDLHVIAGGTLIMPQINDGLFFPEMVMGLRRAGMDTLSNDHAYVIGAAATMNQMEQRSRIPLLQEAARSVAGWAVRNMATVGGNLFNQPPYGDFCVALLALDSKIKIQSATALRMVELSEFMIGGRQLAADELVTEIHIPNHIGQTAFRKFGRRKENAATIVTVAVQIDVTDGYINVARIALGGADRVPMRSPAAEAVLNNSPVSGQRIAEAAAAAAAASSPVSNAVASSWYRRQMIEVQLKRTLSELLGA